MADQSTSEALAMMNYEDNDVVFGRMPVGLDESEFDALPPDEYEITPEDAQDAELFAGEGEAPAPLFSAPEETQFPLFRATLSRFSAAEAQPRVARIDTDDTYGDFVCEHAVKEIERRLDALESAFKAHQDDPFAHAQPPARSELIGAAQAVAKLKSARTASEAAAALPEVPVSLPGFANGKVKCWRDGDKVVCSLRFQAADGSMRIATMAAKPKLDATTVQGLAQSGNLMILGVLPDLAASACANRLVRDTAGAALQARERADVLIGEEPVILVSDGDRGSAPLAALMHLEQMAGCGDEQAKTELGAIREVARTPAGQKVAAPLLLEAQRRLATGRAQKRRGKLMQIYANAAGW